MAHPIPQEHRALRNVLGSFATGVTVITTLEERDHRPVGLTVNSFCSISLSPALVLWSMAKSSPSRELFGEGQSHVIHILADNQMALARQFATPQADKFLGVDYQIPDGFPAPLINGCTARLYCQTDQVMSGGDHDMILAKVLHYELAEAPPLLFSRGNFLSALTCSSTRG